MGATLALSRGSIDDNARIAAQVAAQGPRLRAFVLRVARNRIIDRFRRRAHEPLLIDDVAADATDVLEAWLAPAASGPEAG